MVYMCVYCDNYITTEGWCADCLEYDGLLPVDEDGEVIDYYAEASLFGDC